MIAAPVVIEAPARDDDRIRAAVLLLSDCDAAVSEARDAWHAAGDRWQRARATYELAAQAAQRVIGERPVMVKLSAADCVLVTPGRAGLSFERVKFVRPAKPAEAPALESRAA